MAGTQASFMVSVLHRRKEVGFFLSLGQLLQHLGCLPSHPMLLRSHNKNASPMCSNSNCHFRTHILYKPASFSLLAIELLWYRNMYKCLEHLALLCMLLGDSMLSGMLHHLLQGPS